MKIAAITLTYNRLDLTKRTIEAFRSKTSVDYHLFVDNGSTDGTREFLEDYHRVQLEKNLGIATGFALGVKALADIDDFDYILKLDNDVETVTDEIIAKMVDFLEKAGPHAVSPLDAMIDPNYYPRVIKTTTIHGYRVQYVSHTGGAFQIAPAKFVRRLCADYHHLKLGDYAIGPYYRGIGCPPAYMTDYSMNHIGLNKSTDGDKYIL